MPNIDWTNPGVLLTLTVASVVLLVLGLVLYFRAQRLKGLALASGIVGGLAAGTALGLHLVPATPPHPVDKPDEQRSSEAVSPPIPVPNEDRRSAAAKPSSSATWYVVQSGDVVVTLLEAGVIESADSADVIVKVHAGKAGGIAGTIKSIVADGSTVQKNQVVVELDDGDLRELIKRHKAALERSKTELTLTEKQAELDLEKNRLDVEEARHQLALAERDLQAYKGGDAERKKGLELKVKEAQQRIKTRQFQTTATTARADDARRTAQAAVERETNRLKELETDLANCKLLAPRAGQVVYNEPVARFGAPSGPPAVGQPVREGQILLSIPDLSRMQVSLHIHETQIARVRLDQKAQVRIIAFPNRTLGGRVSRIAAKATAPRFFAPGEVVFPLTVALTDPLPRLRPDMNAEVRIEGERRDKVLRVPLQALQSRDDKIVCFVKSGTMMQERPVTVGLRDAFFAEIRDGLKEGDEILRNVSLATKPREREPDPAKPVVTAAARIVIRSLKPEEDASDKRMRIAVFGITPEDEKRLQALPGVARGVPMRFAVLQAQHDDRRHQARIVGTTPSYQEAYPLELAAGRFLNAEDDKTNNVVLGFHLAQALFPGEKALNETVQLGNFVYRVVGVLKERKHAGEGTEAGQVNDDAYVPLATMQERFGVRITVRQAGRFMREQVYLHQLLLIPAKREQVRSLAEEARTLLEAAHKKKDWQVEIVAAP